MSCRRKAKMSALSKVVMSVFSLLVVRFGGCGSDGTGDRVYRLGILSSAAGPIQRIWLSAQSNPDWHYGLETRARIEGRLAQRWDSVLAAPRLSLVLIFGVIHRWQRYFHASFVS